MRENRLYGSEGGETGYSTGLSYPYHLSAQPGSELRNTFLDKLALLK